MAMKIYFNLENSSFIHEELWGDKELPSGCIELSEQEYLALLACVPGRQELVVRDGRPVVVDLPTYNPTHEDLVAQAHARRRAAYAAESDPLRNEADYDALVNGTEPDYTAWRIAVAAIKARYPLPEKQQ